MLTREVICIRFWDGPKLELFSFSLILVRNQNHMSKFWDGPLFLVRKFWDEQKFEEKWYPRQRWFEFWAISESDAYDFTCQHLLRWLFWPSQRPPVCDFKYKNVRPLETKVILHWILYGYEVRYFSWKWLFHFWIHRLRCFLILLLGQTIKGFNLPVEMTADKKLSIGINRIQVTCHRFQFTYLGPLFIFEHCFVQVKNSSLESNRLI